MQTTPEAPRVMETSQLEMLQYADLPPDMEAVNFMYMAGRACLPHCVAAYQEQGDGMSRLDELVTFIVEHAGRESAGVDNGQYYRSNIGWLWTPIAQRLRSEQRSVVVQNLTYGTDGADMNRAREAGRVANDREAALLRNRMQHGGDPAQWHQSLDATLESGGMALPNMQIPGLIEGPGKGRHSVLVLGRDGDSYTYFDPDTFALERYGMHGLPVPNITRVPDTPQLIYKQPVDDFTARMNGEVMHLQPAIDN